MNEKPKIKQELIDAADKLKSYCDKNPICRLCDFYFAGQGCGINGRPDKWFFDEFIQPINTMKDKYNEIFGIGPFDRGGDYICPHNAGFLDVECDDAASCAMCCNKFWNSEYIKRGEINGNNSTRSM